LSLTHDHFIKSGLTGLAVMDDTIKTPIHPKWACFERPQCSMGLGFQAPH
jgi:hypothetical protein